MLITYGSIKCSEIKQFQPNIKYRTKLGNVLVKILLNFFFLIPLKRKKSTSNSTQHDCPQMQSRIKYHECLKTVLFHVS